MTRRTHHAGESGGRIESRFAKDEEEAVSVALTERRIHRRDQQEERERRHEAAAKAKITLPKFSWDK